MELSSIGSKYMKNSHNNERKKMLKILLAVMDITPNEIAKALNVHRSVICKHLSGEKLYNPCDIYLIEIAFQVQVTEFKRCR